MGGFNFFEFLRALSFGGLVGAGIAGVLYVKFPYLRTFTSLQYFVIYGGLLGAGGQRVVEGAVNTLLFPLGRFISHYQKLIELDLLRYWGKISDEEYRRLSLKLTEVRFFGAPLPDKSQVPPHT